MDMQVNLWVLILILVILQFWALMVKVLLFIIKY